MSKAGPAKGAPPGQLSLGFPEKPQSFDTLAISSANETAISIARRPQNWPFPVLCITGQPRSGLTVLANAWSREFEGRYLTAKEFSALKLKALAKLEGTHVVIDDADQVSNAENLLSLINMVMSGTGQLLLTSKSAPGTWTTSSADLKSRLNSLAVVEIHEPDQPMLEARLRMAAARHFLKLEPEVVNYLVPRLELSYEAVETFAEKLSEGVTLTGRAPSIPLAREVLEGLGWVDPGQRTLL